MANKAFTPLSAPRVKAGVGGIKMRRKHIIFAGAAVAVMLVWFLGVDRSWFVENCPSCGFGRDILQYRVFGAPIHERVQEDTTLLQRVAQDLGAACAHPKLERWHKYRWWGLCICACPRISGTHRMGGDMSWYNDTVAAKVRQLGLLENLCRTTRRWEPPTSRVHRPVTRDVLGERAIGPIF